MTPQNDLDELQRLLDAATPGEWLAASAHLDRDDGNWSIMVVNPIMPVVVGCSDDTVYLSRADAEFIAAAHNAMPALIAEVRWRRELAENDGKGGA
jgi:hypothetical protein